MATSSLPRCSDCGDNAIVVYEVDGTTDAICKACLREARDVAATQMYAEQIHDRAHPFAVYGCLGCVGKQTLHERLQWLLGRDA